MNIVEIGMEADMDLLVVKIQPPSRVLKEIIMDGT
jgi:hypothetical protein